MALPHGRVVYLALYSTAMLVATSLSAQEARFDKLKAQVEELYKHGDYVAATPVAMEDLRVAEATFGPDDPHTATALNDLALLYEKQSKFAEAEPLSKRALEVREKALGPDDPDVGRSLSQLAEVYEKEARYAEAVPLYLRSEHVLEKALGADSLDVATTIGNLALVYQDQSKYADAEPLFERALSIDTKLRDPNDPELAADLNNLAELYDEENKYSEEEPLLKRALQINENAYGADHPYVAMALNNLAELYIAVGKYAQAEPLLKRSLSIREKRFGQDNPEVAVGLTNLAELYEHQGLYAAAEPLFLRALRIDEKALGADHPEVATDLNNLANHYYDEGKYANAEPLFQRSLAIREKAQGENHPDVANALNSLGELYFIEGRYDEAKPLLLRALKIDDATLDPYSTDTAMVLNNLATLAENEGAYADAEGALQLVLQIDEQVDGADHPDIAKALGNLAEVYVDEKKYAEAEPLYQRSLQIDEKMLGANHLDVANDLNSLASLHQAEGKYADVETLYRRAIQIQEKVLGPDHPDVANTVNNLAGLYDEQGRFADAETQYRRAFDSIFHQFQYNFTYMTEKERLEFLGTVENCFPIYFSFVYRFEQKDPQLAGTMYNLLLWEKGFIVGSITEMRRQIEASGDTDALKLLDELSAKRTQIATLLNVKPPDRELWREEIDQLSTEADEIEKTLVARSSAFAEKKKLDRTTWEQVRDALKPGEAAVEFARFGYFDKQWIDKSYYVALVITHETKDHPEFIVLGDDKQIEGEALTPFKHSVQTRGMSAEDEATLPGAHAYDLMWRPLENALAGVTRIYLSPDGILNEVPIGIIPTPDGKLLMERYDIRLLSSSKDILRAPSPQAAANALLVGDPVFQLSEEQQRAALQKLAMPKSEAHAAPATDSRSDVLPSKGNDSELPQLPGTGAEVSAIAELMQGDGWKTGVYTRDDALKHVVEAASSPRVVHLATHGFFLPDQKIAANGNGQGEKKTAALQDPMLRSGLYFAGADRTLAGKATDAGLDNGVLTALEAENLNLTGTELVVLSACNTGQGDVKNGEGVFGLRRAFQEAGAQAVMMSLWSVPDKETRELMQLFYSKWLSGMEKHEALKLAQLEIREKVKSSHNGQDLPYYWGAFVLVGR